MDFLFPLIAAVMQASSFAFDKLILSIKKATHNQYLLISFPLITIFTLIIFLIFKPHLGLDLFDGNYLLLIMLSIIMMIIGNLIFYNALKQDLLSEIQSIELLRYFPVIIFSALIFPDERNYINIALAMIAAGSIIWSHWEKGFKIMKPTIILLSWNLIASPFGELISKALLEIWNPISLQLIVDASASIFFIALFYKSIKKLPKGCMPYFLLTNLLTSIAWILYFYSYQSSGIIYTILIFSLQPMLVYFAGIFFFKEKSSKKKTISFFIILAAIIFAQMA